MLRHTLWGGSRYPWDMQKDTEISVTRCKLLQESNSGKDEKVTGPTCLRIDIWDEIFESFWSGRSRKEKGRKVQSQSCLGGLFLWPFLFTSTWRLGEANWSIIWGSRIYTKVESSAGESEFPLSRKSKKCYPSRIGLELHLVESKT